MAELKKRQRHRLNRSPIKFTTQVPRGDFLYVNSYRNCKNCESISAMNNLLFTYMSEEDHNYWIGMLNQVDVLKHASQEFNRVADSLAREDCLKARLSSRKLSLESAQLKTKALQVLKDRYSHLYRQ